MRTGILLHQITHTVFGILTSDGILTPDRNKLKREDFCELTLYGGQRRVLDDCSLLAHWEGQGQTARLGGRPFKVTPQSPYWLRRACLLGSSLVGKFCPL